MWGFDLTVSSMDSGHGRLQDLTMLSEMQVHGTYMMRHRNRNYRIPAAYQKATNEFLSYRRFCGIIEKNMGTISLCLERFFHYLASQEIDRIECITGKHIHGFLRYISAYSNQSKSHMMRTVRPLTLPLLEDVGWAIIDYLKFGRSTSNSDAVFLYHSPI